MGKKTVLWFVGIVVAAAWASLLVGMQMDLERSAWIIWVTSVAVITEIGIWTVAAVLGVAVVQARKTIWQWLCRPFRRAA